MALNPLKVAWSRSNGAEILRRFQDGKDRQIVEFNLI